MLYQIAPKNTAVFRKAGWVNRIFTQTVGEVFVFVDECHRTQSGKLHRTMKAMLPKAVFIGFTGTPLLKKDKQTASIMASATPFWCCATPKHLTAKSGMISKP